MQHQHQLPCTFGCARFPGSALRALGVHRSTVFPFPYYFAASVADWTEVFEGEQTRYSQGSDTPIRIYTHTYTHTHGQTCKYVCKYAGPELPPTAGGRSQSPRTAAMTPRGRRQQLPNGDGNDYDTGFHKLPGPTPLLQIDAGRCTKFVIFLRCRHLGSTVDPHPMVDEPLQKARSHFLQPGQPMTTLCVKIPWNGRSTSVRSSRRWGSTGLDSWTPSRCYAAVRVAIPGAGEESDARPHCYRARWLRPDTANNSWGKPYHEGGVACQVAPPCQELRRWCLVGLAT